MLHQADEDLKLSCIMVNMQLQSRPVLHTAQGRSSDRSGHLAMLRQHPGAVTHSYVCRRQQVRCYECDSTGASAHQALQSAWILPLMGHHQALMALPYQSLVACLAHGSVIQEALRTHQALQSAWTLPVMNHHQAWRVLPYQSLVAWHMGG